MTTQDAIKFCFTTELYDGLTKRNSLPEMVKLACLVAFKRNWERWPDTSEHYAVTQKLRDVLLILEATGNVIP